MIANLLYFFFFSSRRRHTRSLRDWSSDVCSSDLRVDQADADRGDALVLEPPGRRGRGLLVEGADLGAGEVEPARSEERRVGKECRSRWAPDHYKKKTECA